MENSQVHGKWWRCPRIFCKSALEQKRKLLNDEIDELQKKKRCLQTDIASLTASADEYAENAEQTHQMPWITKSNSSRISREVNEVVLDWTDCFVTEIRVHTPVVLSYDNSYDEQVEIYFYSGKQS